MHAITIALSQVKKVNVMEGVGMQGWVAVDDDWKHVAVGNERLFKVRLIKTLYKSSYKYTIHLRLAISVTEIRRNPLLRIKINLNVLCLIHVSRTRVVYVSQRLKKPSC